MNTRAAAADEQQVVERREILRRLPVLGDHRRRDPRHRGARRGLGLAASYVVVVTDNVVKPTSECEK